MLNILSCAQRRRVCSANFMHYHVPVLHSDRIMAEHDLIYLIEGGWEIIEDGRRYVMEPDSVLLLAAGRHHYGETACLPGTRTMFIHIAAIPEDAAPDPSSFAIPSLTRAAPPSVRRGFRNIINEFYTNGPKRDIRLSALTDLLLSDLAGAPESTPKTWPVDDVRALLLKNPEANPTAETLASSLGLTARRLRYLFRTASGIPLHRYQLELKLDMAKQLLITEPGRTLSDVAETFGFTDAFHLSHAFKRRFGYAPREEK